MFAYKLPNYARQYKNTIAAFSLNQADSGVLFCVIKKVYKPFIF